MKYFVMAFIFNIYSKIIKICGGQNDRKIMFKILWSFVFLLPNFRIAFQDVFLIDRLSFLMFNLNW